jgi:hypothetical protein
VNQVHAVLFYQTLMLTQGGSPAIFRDFDTADAFRKNLIERGYDPYQVTVMTCQVL